MKWGEASSGQEQDVCRTSSFPGPRAEGLRDLACGLEAGFALYLASFLWQLIPRPLPTNLFLPLFFKL